MPNCKSFLVTEAERKHVRRRARFRQHGDASCHRVFFFLQGKAPKEIHAIQTYTLGGHAPSYATVKNWVAQFKRGDYSTCDAPCPGRPKTVTTPDISSGFPMSCSLTLFSGSGPVGLPPVPWTEKKNNRNVTIFRPTRRSLLPRKPGWADNLLIFFFFSCLQKLEQRVKKCIELRGEYVC